MNKLIRLGPAQSRVVCPTAKKLSRTGGPAPTCFRADQSRSSIWWVKQLTMLVGWHVSSG